MNIPKSKSVPAIIISDFDSNYEDPFLKLKSADTDKRIQNKIITSPTNSFEEKVQIENKKPKIPSHPNNGEKRGGEGEKNRSLTKTKVGNYFTTSDHKFILFRICPSLKVSRMSPRPLAPVLHQQQSRRAKKRLRPASTKSDLIQNFRKIFKIPLTQKKNYAKQVVKRLFK